MQPIHWPLYCKTARTWDLPCYFPHYSTMDYNTKRISYRLGCRLEQGLHPMLCNQGGVEKLATESKRGSVSNVIQLKKKLRLGIWNVCNMLQLGKMQLLSRELERLHLTVCK